MYEKLNYKTMEFPHNALLQPLSAMSEEEFAALGAEGVVFARPISGIELARFIPEARNVPEDAVFQMVMSADGSPVLVTDNKDTVFDWLEDSDVTLVQRH